MFFTVSYVETFIGFVVCWTIIILCFSSVFEFDSLSLCVTVIVRWYFFLCISKLDHSNDMKDLAQSCAHYITGERTYVLQLSISSLLLLLFFFFFRSFFFCRLLILVLFLTFSLAFRVLQRKKDFTYGTHALNKML